VPETAGVAQLVGDQDRNLLVGMAANLRRWAASNLGLGKPAKKGVRPKTNLRPVATALRHATTDSGFEQRLVYERLMVQHVPLEERRDLKPPAYLRLDAEERFPRVTVVERAGDGRSLFGPLRDRRSAMAVRDAVHKLHPLRPCDYDFEPDPELPLGKGCVYAQVRSCAAPCLARVTEVEYRGIARNAVALLASCSRRSEGDAGLPAWAAAAETRALAIEALAGRVHVFPIRDGRVLDSEVFCVADAELENALAALRFDASSAPDDTPWLLAWLRERRRTGVYLVIEDGVSRSGSALSNIARSALAAAARKSPAVS
jgi:hypothetical protein